MATSSTLVCSSRHFSRGYITRISCRPACLPLQIASPLRQLTTSTRIFQKIIETPSRGPEVPLTTVTSAPSGTHARSIALLKLPIRAAPSDIEALIQSKGLNMYVHSTKGPKPRDQGPMMLPALTDALLLTPHSTSLQIKIDRFSFQNDSRCYIELASEKEAQKAIELLNDTEFMHRTIRAAPLKEDFVWGAEGKREDGRQSRYVQAIMPGPSEALKPLFEGRRMMFSVQPPGWAPESSSVSQNQFATGVIETHLEKYGIEAIGGLKPFYGDKGSHPRMLCFIDFKTKSGADQAVQAVHETDIKGRTVWLQPSVLAPWRAHQVGKVDQGLLAELQTKGLASKEPYEDNFVNSDQRKGEKNYKTTRIQRVERKKAEKKKEVKDSKVAN